MVDISILFLWFINQLITGGHHLVPMTMAFGCRKFNLGVPNEPEAQAQLQPEKSTDRSHWIGGKIYRKPMGVSYIPPSFPLNQSNEVAAEFCLVYYQHLNQ